MEGGMEGGKEEEGKDDQDEEGEEGLFEERVRLLAEMHGPHKIALCLTVLGLEPEAGASALLQHILLGKI